MYQSKLTELEEQLDAHAKRHSEERAEQDALNLDKERVLETQLEEYRNRLNAVTANMEVRERQLTKVERRIEEEK